MGAARAAGFIDSLLLRLALNLVDAHIAEITAAVVATEARGFDRFRRASKRLERKCEG